MGFLNKKLSISALKDAVTDAAAKVSETVQGIDVSSAISSVKETVIQISEKTVEVSQVAYEATKEKAVLTYTSASEEVRNFDYSQLSQADFYKERYTHYKDLSESKISECFRNTFEVDKSTMQMVDDVRSRLPVPVTTVDDIFEQCKREAIRRAIASFGLAGLVQNLDSHSEAKYSNLSESYSEYKGREASRIKSHENYAAMSDIRTDAIKQDGIFATVVDGYNKDVPLFAVDAQVEHVIAKKELYDDKLVRMGTTDKEINDVINSPDNLVFAYGNFNGSLQDRDIFKHMEKNGRVDADNPDIVYVTIKRTGEEVALNRKDVEDAYSRADEKRNEHRLAAAKEVGMTVVKSGAAMAAQQVVGLIVVETIDIFIDEIRNFTINGKIINADGWLQNTKDATARIQQRLSDRFEERQIWARAKELGIESGVAGALSVIPQILISFIVKMPSFVLAMIRESTLSIVRCVRVLASNDDNKLDSITVILAGSASAIVSVYASRVISKAIAAVPLLNRFNIQVSEVLTGLFVTAAPLTAIYAFEQNKQKLQFIASKFTRFGENAVDGVKSPTS